MDNSMSGILGSDLGRGVNVCLRVLLTDCVVRKR